MIARWMTWQDFPLKRKLYFLLQITAGNRVLIRMYFLFLIPAHEYNLEGI